MMLSGGCKTSPLITLTPTLICLFLALSRTIPISLDCAHGETNAEDARREIPRELLAALKTQLKLALAEIEHQTTGLEDDSEPQTVAEIEDLQNRLHGAIETLNERKGRLKRQ